MSAQSSRVRFDLPAATWLGQRALAAKQIRIRCLAVLFAMLLVMITGSDVQSGGLVDTGVERFQAADFTNSAEISNPWWTLTAGRNFLYFSQDGEDCSWNLMQVLNSTTGNFAGVYAGTNARIVLDREWVDEGCAFGLNFQAFLATNPELEEATYDWYAQDSERNIWYMGENTFDGDYEGSFTAGCDGAEAGIVVLGQPRKGDFYQQEFYEGEAEDWAKVLNLWTRRGTRQMKTKEWTPLERGAIEHKFYRSVGGVGELFMIEEIKEKTVIVSLFAKDIANPPPANGLPISPTPGCPPFTQP